MENKPEIFIIGAPKAGTTSLAEYLNLHPDVFMCFPKEPHYFGSDLPEKVRLTKTHRDYLSLFQAAGEYQHCGEASVWTLYSQKALIELREKYPSAKLIIMLRNPAESTPSLHGQLTYAYYQKEQDLSKAWDYDGDDVLLKYKDIGLQGAQIERALDIFPAEQIHFIEFQYFISHTAECYRDVLAFLNLAEFSPESFDLHNPYSRQKVRWLGRILRPRNRYYQYTIRKFKQFIGVREFGLLNRLERFNLTSDRENTVPQELKEKMKLHFCDDIKILEQLSSLDLSHWKK